MYSPTQKYSRAVQCIESVTDEICVSNNLGFCNTANGKHTIILFFIISAFSKNIYELARQFKCVGFAILRTYIADRCTVNQPLKISEL